MCKRGLVKGGRVEMGEPEQSLANVLFKGRDYCRLVASSHFALIDRNFQEGIVYSPCMLPCY